MSIKILYLVRSYAMGGPQRLVQLMLTHLPHDEFNITTVAYDTRSEHDLAFIDSLEKQGCNIAPERIPWRGPMDWFRARKAIMSLVEKYEVDVIHTHDDQSNMLVGVGRGDWPCACVASAYGWFESKWALNLRTQYTLERRFALPNFDYVYTVSQNMRNKIVRAGTDAERVRVIYTGIDTDQFADLDQRQRVRAEFGIAQDSLVVGTVCRLAVEKGHRHLLTAAQRLMREHPRLELLCVGTGSQRTLLEAQAEQLGIAPRVHFIGFYPDLSAILNSMDIYVLPSILDEGLPTSVLEAQAASLPVVASNVGGTRETINVGVSGLLVEPADPDSLAQVLNELLLDEDRRRLMGISARAWIRESFSPQRMMNEIADIYRLAANQRKAACVSELSV